MSDESDPTATRQRRLSITKLQRKSVPGAELIALCQGVTEDGSLSDFEILALEAWLVANENTALPARDRLFTLLRRFADDGTVSADERAELYRAIELVLPPDIRATVRRTRIAGTRRDRAETLAARQAARDLALVKARTDREAAREARLRARPVDVLDFVVAGVTYEGRGMIVNEYCDEGDVVYLVRDRANAFSRNAVEVRIVNGMQIGFVPEALARNLAPMLDTGHPHAAQIKKVLSGSRAPIPVVLAAIYRPDCGLHNVTFENQVPARVRDASRSGP